jgi:hypothetical protein
VQFDHRREIIGNARQSSTDLFAGHSRRDFVEDQIVGARDKFIVLFLEAGDGYELPPTRAPLLGLADHTAQNAVEPGTDARLIAKLVQPQPCPAARFLDRVLGVGERASAASSEREEAVEVWKHERVEARVTIVE